MLDTILTILIFGTIFASVQALLAMGFTLVYGVGKVLNLAHGGFYIVAGYIIFMFNVELGYPLPIAFIVALIVIMIIGALTYLLLIKELQDNEVSVLIVTFGLAFFFEQFIIVYWGSRPKFVEPLISGTVNVLGVRFAAQSLLIIIATFIIIFALVLFIQKSKLGKSIRAVSQDREAAMLSGINANRMIMYTLIISAFLVGLAAVLRVPGDSIAPHIGWINLTNAFAVVILGGLGSIKGSVLASFLIGISQSFVGTVIGYDFSALIPIIIILLVLIIRPRGLFGKKEVK